MTAPVRKAVILAAGHGTRFLPATKAQPKEMLPLVDRPVIQYVVEEAVAAGLEQIIMVTASNKRAVEDHFDRDPELERLLAAKGENDRLREVKHLADLAHISFVRQKERLGIGHAVLQARPLVGDEPFALFFPDDIIESDVPAIGQLIQVYERYGHSVLAVQQLPREEVVHYGVITPEPVEERVYNVLGIVEKPRLEEAPSDLTTVGRYVLKPEIFPILARTPPGANGEIQLTDSLGLMLKAGHKIYACQYQGERFDTGRPIGLIKASLALALRRPDLAAELKAYVQALTQPAGERQA
ncbi:MAG: UTP--glucose-1-phosphate uridylyltransferase GalU [Chloroflexi bacterium]|nr:UTP--glucose-1-phosphate uridylyltransferase GalU [Chloroflexota bacterium]